jgi:ribosomal protein S18 acetylase RimI-like enzyme
MTTIRLLTAADADLLAASGTDVFDHLPQPRWTAEFLADPRHHLAAAIAPGGRLVGFASGVHYLHPDQAPQLFINEVGVADDWAGQGLGRQLVEALLAHARTLGCTMAWVATQPDNHAALALYARASGRRDPSPFVLFEFPLDAAAVN